MTPHPQRCETCKYIPDRGIVHNKCPITWIGEDDEGRCVPDDHLQAITRTIGCASHSGKTPAPAAPSECYKKGYADAVANALSQHADCVKCLEEDRVTMLEHDATIRNQTLDALFQKANQRQMDVETEEGTIVEVIEKGEVLAWIDELRSTQSTDSEATDR